METLTLNIPESLYERLKHRAEQTNRTLEAELLEVVSAALPADELPTALLEELEQLAYLEDAALWRSAKSHLSQKDSRKLEALTHKQQREGLTGQEEELQQALLRRYERFMLVRAKAATLLKEHRQDISVLLNPQ